MPVALIYGDASPDRLTDGILRDERVQGLMRKMNVEPRLSFEKNIGPNVRPSLRSPPKRRRFTHRLDFAKGEPENPLSPSELEAKFHFMASGVLDEGTCIEMIALCKRLEAVDDIADLYSLLKRSGEKARLRFKEQK